MRKFIIAMVVSLAAFSAQAADVCQEKVDVSVNGLVCDFCAQAIEKVFGKRDEVAGVKVDLDSGHVWLDMKPGQSIDDSELEQLILDSGYNVDAIKRDC